MGAVYTWRTWTFGWLMRLLCQATFYALPGRYVGDEATTRYVLVGNIVVLACMESTIVVISPAGERRMGTLPLPAIAPAGHLQVYLGRGLQWTVTGLAGSSVAWLVLPPLLGVPLPWPRAGYALPVVLLILVGSYGYRCAGGHRAAAARRPMARAERRVRNRDDVRRGERPRRGVPAPLEIAAHALPVVHGLEAVRGILDGAPASRVIGLLGTEALIGACWYAVAALSMDRLLSVGRRAYAG